MQPVIDFLSSQAWQGIQGLVTIIALLLSLSRPREWAEKHAGTKWAVRVPWIPLLVIVGAAAGFGVGAKTGDVYKGLSLALFSACLALGLNWVKLRGLAKTAADYQRLLSVIRRLVQLEQVSTNYRLDGRQMVHKIDDKGNGTLYEEFTIVPTRDLVYFYSFGHTFKSDPEGGAEIKVTAKVSSDRTPLEVLEVDRSNNFVSYVVLLDPPSTAEKPKRIAIECTRKLIWGRLVQQNEDSGVFRLAHPSNTFQIELWAPPGKVWKGFHPTPEVGDVKMEPSPSPTRIVWTIADPEEKKYTYRVFVGEVAGERRG